MLDGVTLTNLDIVPNGVDVPLEGSLLDQVDNCCTAFGWWKQIILKPAWLLYSILYNMHVILWIKKLVEYLYVFL